jgi:hypothetical protein
MRSVAHLDAYLSSKLLDLTPMYQRRWRRQAVDSLQVKLAQLGGPRTQRELDTVEVWETEPTSTFVYHDAIKDSEQARCAMHAAKKRAH